jgi:alpha-glucosidase
LRRAEPALALGSYEPVEAADNLLAYARENHGRRYLIALNLGSQPQTLGAAGRVVLSTFLDREDEAVGETLYLRGDEGLILETVRRPARRS